MRVGDNPARKLAREPRREVRHQLLLPVYVPELEGYYRDALDILDLTLRSAHLARRPGLEISVVANGCCGSALERLRRALDEGEIDRLIELSENHGKIDALLPLLRTVEAPLVTISDADVLFLPDWLERTQEIFRAFPEAGAVSCSPNPALAWWYSSATTLSAMMKRELQRAALIDPADLERFAHSVGNNDFFSEEQKRHQWFVLRAGAVALVGCGHFQLTLRSEVLRWVPAGRSGAALEPAADRRFLDEPIDRAGAWRLSTPRARALHLGNVVEPWMREMLEGLEAEGQESELEVPPAWRRGLIARLPWGSRLRLAGLQRRWLER